MCVHFLDVVIKAPKNNESKEERVMDDTPHNSKGKLLDRDEPTRYVSVGHSKS